MKRDTSETLHLNPCYDNPDSIKAEKTPILSDKSPDTKYTEDTLSISDHLSSYHDSIDIKRIEKPRATFGHLSSVAFVLAELFGITSIITTIFWMLYFDNGLGWDKGMKESNWHPIFMVAGIFFYANAALTSYVLRGHTESLTHYAHCLALLLAFLFTTLGIVCIIGFESERIYLSFHSWIGMVTLLFFVMQAVIGFACLFPKCENPTRKRYMKFQLWICLLVFILATATCLIGNTERILVKLTTTSSSLMYENLMANITSLFLLSFAGVTCTILLHPVYRGNWKSNETNKPITTSVNTSR